MDPNVVEFAYANKKKTVLVYTSKKTMKLGVDSMRIIRQIFEDPFTVDQQNLENMKMAMCKMFNLQYSQNMRINVLNDGFYITNLDNTLHVVTKTPLQEGSNSTSHLIQGKLKYLNLYPHSTTHVLDMASR